MTDHVKLLEQLAKRNPPVIAADTAAAHTRRGYGYLCPDELGDVWTALEEWGAAGRPEPRRSDYPYMSRIPSYARVVTALTAFDTACLHAMGFR